MRAGRKNVNKVFDHVAFVYICKGFTKVERYAGGLLDWQDAGYPLEGSLVKA